MFEKRLEEISRRFGEEKSRDFYVLTHKKHRREIYFTNDERSINFIKDKFKYSYLNKFIYFLIKINILQILLKRIKLHSEFGDVIYVANTIKGFNLLENTVIAFPVNEEKKVKFLEIIELQEIIGDLKPPTISFNREIPYYKEELIWKRFKGDLIIPLRLLKDFNEKTGYIHGSFMEDHIYEKGDSCVFIDWAGMKKGDYEEDIKYYIELLRDRANKGRIK